LLSGYPIDSLGSTRNNILKERIDSIPPPLEDAPFEQTTEDASRKLQKN
jgi:hypothetical protein